MMVNRLTSKALQSELQKDNFLMLCFGVAKELGYTVGKLMAEATREEILGWSAYFAIQNAEQEKAMERASRRR